MAFVNSVLSKAHAWGQQLFVAKLDIQRMFASVNYNFLFECLLFFGIPFPWAQAFMHQVKGNVLELSTLTREQVHIFMQQGVLEGSPTSIIAVAVILTRLLQQLKSHPMYSSSAASLESDSIQPGVTLHPLGWLDDWLFFASDLDSPGSLLSIWAGLCEKANWKLHLGQDGASFKQ